HLPTALQVGRGYDFRKGHGFRSASRHASFPRRRGDRIASKYSLLSLSEHAPRAAECPFWGEGGHRADTSQCLLLTQCRHLGIGQGETLNRRMTLAYRSTNNVV